MKHAKLSVIFATCFFLYSFALSSYNLHVFFDNSLTENFYYYSHGASVLPSEVELANDKIPIEEDIYFSPPNSLKLKWVSKPGGDWSISINAKKWRGRNTKFVGDTLSFWCYSEKIIPAHHLPQVSLKNTSGSKTPQLRLNLVIDAIPEKKWIQIKVPFSQFDYSQSMVHQTRAYNFDHEFLNSIIFSQRIDDGHEQTLYIDEIKIYNGGYNDKESPSTPRGLEATGYDRHIDLKWKPNNEDDLQYYKIYRSPDNANFKQIEIQSSDFNRFTDFLGEFGKTAFYKISALDYNNNESRLSENATATTHEMEDEELLTMVQEASFRYYWEGGHPNSGLARENIPGRENLVAIGASGFGIMAIIVGMERNFITRPEGAMRLLKILNFLQNADRFHGVWPHFLDDKTGKVIPLFGKYDNGGDLVETSFLMQGLLVARQYFNGEGDEERLIYKQITHLWESVEWDWYRKTSDSDFLYWHWSPDVEWIINHPLIGWNETMITYLLAIASPTHSVPASLYHSGWAGQSERAVQYRQNWGKTNQGDHYTNGNTYYGINLDVGVGSGGPLFFTHYSFMAFDPRNKRDKYTNYFKNNRNLALINRAYCIENPHNFSGYGENYWGLTASDNHIGYKAHDPTPRNDNGTMTPTGALASMPYTPEESMAALKHYYQDLGANIWDIYGFRDAFNLTENWVSGIYMGLNQAPVVVMIENYRSGLIWKLFMLNPEIQLMLDAIGFKPDLKK
jgi:hypothetical protein